MPWSKSKNDSDRGHWSNKFDYNISVFGYAIGIITFWRFPYLAYENSGAPFLYAFFILYLLIGIPIIFLETAWGQYGNLAPLLAFKAVPAMQGIGICMLFLSCGLIIYFGSASYYILLYLASSFSYKQPWTTCKNSWNSDYCYTFAECNNSEIVGFTNSNSSITSCNVSMDANYSTPSIEFWVKNLAYDDNVCAHHVKAYKIIDGLDSSNIILDPLIIFFSFASVKVVLCFIALIKHVRLTGKISYLLSPLTFIIIVIMLIRCVTLEGSINGLIALLIPYDLISFLNPKVWKDACSQVFLTLMASSGGLITWSSYNRFYNKYQIDAAVLLVTLPIVSMMSAISVFSVAGYFGNLFNTDPLLAFESAKGPIAPLVAYSEAALHMWGGSLPWGIIIFSILFLSSSAALLPFAECILSSLSDAIPIFRNLYLRNLMSFTLLVLAMATYLGVPCFLPGAGLQVIDFFDTFSLTLSLIIVAVVEVLLVFYSFGFKLLYTNTKAMTGSACLKSHFWSFLWGGFTPLIMLACFFYTIYGLFAFGPQALAPTTEPEINNIWINISGGVFVGFIFFVWLVVALIRAALSRGTCSEKLRAAFCSHSSRYSDHVSNYSSHRNGNIFLGEYSRPGRIEILIDEDIITTV